MILHKKHLFWHKKHIIVWLVLIFFCIFACRMKDYNLKTEKTNL